jgi:hypothetical protein
MRLQLRARKNLDEQLVEVMGPVKRVRYAKYGYSHVAKSLS